MAIILYKKKYIYIQFIYIILHFFIYIFYKKQNKIEE
jgi:hypothetical protein